MWLTPTTKGYGHASMGQTMIFRKKVEAREMTEQQAEEMLGCTLRPPRMEEWKYPKKEDQILEKTQLLWDAEPNVGRVANGVSNRVHRLRCLGNSIVPQVVARIFYSIKEAENDRKI